jgi:hypothetical protein
VLSRHSYQRRVEPNWLPCVVFLGSGDRSSGYHPAELPRQQVSQRVVVGAVPTLIGVIAPAEASVSEAPVPLLIPPELLPLPRGGRLPAAPLALPAQAQSSDIEFGPIIVGVAAIDGSGRVRERTVLAALAWGPGETLDMQIIRDVDRSPAQSSGPASPSPAKAVHSACADQQRTSRDQRSGPHRQSRSRPGLSDHSTPRGNGVPSRRCPQAPPGRPGPALVPGSAP